MDKIDFVVTWVDGNDPDWLQGRSNYMPNSVNSGTVNERFRDWDLMQYWFRGIEKFAPWVNNVYFVTCGHYPKWLNLEHPKLKLVKHSDYIPKVFLPTYNSNVIELNLHRIPDLSEKFVLFNDDFFLIDSVKEEEFFKKGLPCETALLSQLTSPRPGDLFAYSILNNMAIINKYFSKKEVTKKHFHKFYTFKYGKELIRNILLYPAKWFSNFNDLHICSSYLKSTFNDVWNKEPIFLENCCHNKFRDKDDLTHWLMKSWQICSGNFEPRKVNWGKAYNINNIEEYKNDIINQRYKCICLNDSDLDKDFDILKEEVKDIFEKILPEKSSFEL